MIIAEARAPVTTGGIEESADFTIDLTPEMADLLSSGVYSDPIAAVIREPACNAYDAHVEVGKRDVPFIVGLPTHLDPTFYVEDYGPGLSHEAVMQLYTKYGKSTKQGTNDQIGAFGIGSKAPLSYVEAFDVTSWYNGVKRTYTCYRSEAGTPRIALMSEEPTDRENGLRVSFPVNASDIQAFRSRAATVLRWFLPTPIINGDGNFQIKERSYEIVTPTWRLRKYNYYDGDMKPYAIQGNVAYQLEASAFRHLTERQQTILSLPLEIFFDVGELTVAASREHLRYTAKTQDALKARLDEIAEEVYAHYSMDFDECDTLWEAKIRFRERINNGSIHPNLRDALKENATYDGNKLNDESITVSGRDLPKGVTVVSVSIKESRRSRIPLRAIPEWSSVSVLPDNNVVVLYDDGATSVQRRLKANCYNRRIIIIRGPEDKLDDTLAMFGNPPVQKLSELPEPPRESRSGYRSPVAKLVEYDRHEFIPTNHDVEDGGLYVQLYRGEPEDPKFYAAVDYGRKLGVLDQRVFGINASHRNVAKKEGWKPVVPYVKEKFEEWLRHNDPAKSLANEKELSEHRHDRLFDLIRLFDYYGITPSKPRSKWAKFVRAVEKLQDSPVKEPHAARALAQTFNIKLPERKPQASLGPLIDECYTRYPILKFLDFWNLRNDEDGLRAVAAYIDNL